MEVARCYYFEGYHAVPGLPHPWDKAHWHRWTVEVVAAGPVVDGIVVDTDELDKTWHWLAQSWGLLDAHRDNINDCFPMATTVENLATYILQRFKPPVIRVKVQEDKNRWAQDARPLPDAA